MSPSLTGSIRSAVSVPTIVGATGLALAGVLLWRWLGAPATSLSTLDLFFVGTTCISIAINIWQIARDRHKYAPLKYHLIALFNDLKSRQLRTFQREQLLLLPVTANLPQHAIVLSFVDFIRETQQGLEQLREQTVGAIYSVDPDVSGTQVFRAAEFGLNEEEMKIRKEHMRRYADGFRAVDPLLNNLQSGGPQQAPSQPQASTTPEVRQ